MKNLKYLFFCLLLLLSAGFAFSNEEDYSVSSPLSLEVISAGAFSETELWAEMAFKHSLVQAIDAFFSVNTALGIPANSPDRILITIPAAAGALAVNLYSFPFLQRGIRTLTPNNKMTPYLEEYKSIISSLDELKKLRGESIQTLDSLVNRKPKPKAKTPQISTQNSASRLSPPPLDQNNTTKPKTRKRPPSINAQMNTAMAEIQHYDREIDKLYQKSINHIKTRPGLLYRSGRLLRKAGLVSVLIGGIAFSSFIIGDTIIILFDRDDQLLEISYHLKKDIFEIAGELNVEKGIELN